MTAEANVEFVRGLWAAFGRGDMAPFVGALADDVELTIQGPSELPFTGTARGRDAALAVLGRIAEVLEPDVHEPREFIGQGDTVVVLGHERGTGKATGRPYEADWAQVYTVRDGRIVAIREYGDTAAWLAAHRGS